MMTRKHFEAIASAFALVRQSNLLSLDADYALTMVETALCGVFQGENPAFDREKFHYACKLGKKELKHARAID